MDIHKELMHGQGYAVIPVENMETFIKLRDSFVERINISNGSEKNIEFVRKAIAKMSKAEINKSMIDILKFTNLSEMIVNSFPKLIESLCGKKLFIQRRATMIMNVPGEGQAKQWPHYELMSGISPFTYVIWAPLHDLEDQSGAYYINRQESLEIMKKRGFKTFDKWWDESYDDEPNSWKRLQMVMDVVYDLSKIGNNEWMKMLWDMEEILQHNTDLINNYSIEKELYNRIYRL